MSLGHPLLTTLAEISLKMSPACYLEVANLLFKMTLAVWFSNNLPPPSNPHPTKNSENGVEPPFLTLPIPIIPDKEKKPFIFTLLCGASKGFMKGLKAFMKPFETPQRSVKIKIWLTFCLSQYNFQKCTGREGLKQSLNYTELSSKNSHILDLVNPSMQKDYETE